MYTRPRISVIVPVYNMEKYLRKCLDSLVNQTMKDIEIIVVNDGSKDSSLSIMNEYKEKYPECIKVIDKVNGGLSDARNAGIDVARGDYIGFVDSDDYVDLHMYEKMYVKAIEKNFDVVVCDLEYVYPDHKVPAYSNLEEDLLTREEVKKSMLTIYPTAWNKLYHRRLFDYSQIRFCKNIWYEDVEFIHRLYPYITSIGVVKEAFYQYIQRDGSIMTTFNMKTFDYLKNWNSIIEYYRKHRFYNEYKKELEYCCVRYLYATFIKTAANFPDKNIFDDAVEKAMQLIKKEFPHYRRNSYFYTNGLKGLYLVSFNKAVANLVYKQARRGE